MFVAVVEAPMRVRQANIEQNRTLGRQKTSTQTMSWLLVAAKCRGLHTPIRAAKLIPYLTTRTPISQPHAPLKPECNESDDRNANAADRNRVIESAES